MTVSWSNLTCVAARDIEVRGRKPYSYAECSAKLSSLLSSHAARATIKPARYVRMRTIVVAIT